MNKLNCIIKDSDLLPKYETLGASGMDLKASSYSFPDELKDGIEHPLKDGELLVLSPGQRVLVKTGLSIDLPENIEAEVRPRSGLAIKHGITVVNTPGTVDEDFKGEIGVILINHGNKPFIISYGDRIAQLVFMAVEKFKLNPVQSLSESNRGTGAYGSTGK